MLRTVLNKILNDLSVTKSLSTNKIKFLVNYLETNKGLKAEFEEFTKEKVGDDFEKITIKDSSNKTILDLRYRKGVLVYSTFYYNNCIDVTSETFQSFRDEIRDINDNLFSLVKNNGNTTIVLNRIDDKGNLYKQVTNLVTTSDSLNSCLEEIIDDYAQWLFTDISLAFGVEELRSNNYLKRFNKTDFEMNVQDAQGNSKDTLKPLKMFD